jgi:tetratricopeptide (TPR) repeat protein
MQRHGRHDHGFTVPDPLMTKQLGIPNACNRCHTDKDVDWAVKATDEWYGSKMDRPSRKRTRTVAAARRGGDSAKAGLIGMLGDEKEYPYWRAVAAGLLTRWAGDPEAMVALMEGLKHPQPLVRANAAHALEGVVQRSPSIQMAIRKLLDDPSRNVRMTAAGILRETIDPQSPVGREFEHFVNLNTDQPTGQLQKGLYELARQRPEEAIGHFKKALEWDPRSSAMRQQVAMIYSSIGRTKEAVEQLQEAIRLDPANTEYPYQLGLAYAESGDIPQAVKALERAVKVDPHNARAWYNLGLARNSGRDPQGAVAAMERAEAIDGGDPDIPYARATILLQQRKIPEAAAAAQKALQIRPDYRPAMNLLQSLQ